MLMAIGPAELRCRSRVESAAGSLMESPPARLLLIRALPAVERVLMATLLGLLALRVVEAFGSLLELEKEPSWLRVRLMSPLASAIRSPRLILLAGAVVMLPASAVSLRVPVRGWDAWARVMSP